MEREIVELLSLRDERGIELVVQQYEKLIRYIAGTILGDRETSVEECVNDVYLKLWEHGAEYDYGKASFVTYIKAITRNTALNYLRKLKKREELEEADETDSLLAEYIDYSQNLEHKVIVREEVDALNRILGSLHKKDRELLLRRFYYLQSTRQVAEAMEMSENAVDSKLSRLRKKIRKSYEKEAAK